MPKLQNLLKRRPEAPPDPEERARLDKRLASLRNPNALDEEAAASESIEDAPPDAEAEELAPAERAAGDQTAAELAAAEQAAPNRPAAEQGFPEVPEVEPVGLEEHATPGLRVEAQPVDPARQLARAAHAGPAKQAAAERAAAQRRAVAEKRSVERAAARQRVAEKAAAEQRAAEDWAATERAAAEAAAAELAAAAEQAAEAKAASDRAAEDDRAAADIRAAAEIRAAVEEARVAAEQAEAAQRAEAERAVAERRAEAERAAAERRAAKERAAAEQRAAREAERAVAQRAATEKRAAATAERAAREAAAAEQRAAAAAARAAAEQAVAEQRAAAAAERAAVRERAEAEKRAAAAQRAADQRALADQRAAELRDAAERRAAEKAARAAARPPVLARLLGRARPARDVGADGTAVQPGDEAAKPQRGAAPSIAAATLAGSGVAGSVSPPRRTSTRAASTPSAGDAPAAARPRGPKAAAPLAELGRARPAAEPGRPARPGKARVQVASCPYCADALPMMPSANTRCPRCRQRIVVRRLGDRTVLLTEAALPVFLAQRKQAVHAPRWTRERDRWLDLATKSGAAADRIARIRRDPLSNDLVGRARALYVSTVEQSARLARRERRWDEASRLSLDLALTLYKAVRSPRPVPAEIVGFHREGLGSTLRGIGEIAKSVELRAASCCPECQADDGRVARISEELRAQTLPHPACPKGLCRCRWYLADRDRTIVTSLLRRQTRPPRPHRPAVEA